jgi:hypothetical protein
MKRTNIQGIALLMVIILNSCSSINKMSLNQKSDDDVYNTEAKAGELYAPDQYDYGQQYNYNDYAPLQYNLYNDYSYLNGYNLFDNGWGFDFALNPWDDDYYPYWGLGYDNYLNGGFNSTYWAGNARPYYNNGINGRSAVSTLSTITTPNYLLRNAALNPTMSHLLQRPSYLNHLGLNPLLNRSRNYNNQSSRPVIEQRQPIVQPSIERFNPGGSFGGGRMGGGGRPGRP